MPATLKRYHVRCENDFLNIEEMIGFMCLGGGGGFGAFADMTLKVDLSMGSNMYGFPEEKRCVFGGGGFGSFAEMTFKVDRSMGSKKYGFP